MKALSVLGTSSNAGKSWVATALCAWLRRQGVRVAPFKAQNMANNAYATLEGGEMGVAQAVQAEACGLRPVVGMNPILLKPNGPDGSQVVRLGQAGEVASARRYYAGVEEAWRVARETLDSWRDRCEVLVLEGAGSPVELNLMDRDIVNLRPIQYLGGKWLLVANIEYGGVFAQAVGTWRLLPEAVKEIGLGLLVNRFRGDVSLFASARSDFERHMPLPYLGVLPFERRLTIDDEDSLNAEESAPPRDAPYLAWVKFPFVSNSQDQYAWREDEGVANVWTRDAEVLLGAAAIVLPGTKNTLADLRWLKASGLAGVLRERAREGVLIVGVCGGFQMLGDRVVEGEDSETGLGLLSARTMLLPQKKVLRRWLWLEDQRWETYEIHTGVTEFAADAAVQPLFHIEGEDGRLEPEGVVAGNVWGTYQHGLFDAAAARRAVLTAAGVCGVRVNETDWRTRRRRVYDDMAELLERAVDLEPVRRYLGL